MSMYWRRVLVWRILWPIRAYIRYSPIHKGKSFLERNLLDPLIPRTPTRFVARLRDGILIELTHGDVLGRTVMMEGDFEPQERKTLAAKVVPGSTVIDVGANIGLFSVSLAKAADQTGKVIAIEPLDANGKSLTRNVELNGLKNVSLHLKAASELPGTILFHLAHDPAFHTTVGSSHLAKGLNESITVETIRLDDVWISEGRPFVSVVKVDVEGAEMAVLRGAVQLIEECRPCLMLEANGPEKLAEQKSFLAQYGYTGTQPKGFMPWNHLYQAPSQSGSIRSSAE